jgi:hypothetical protein
MSNTNAAIATTEVSKERQAHEEKADCYGSYGNYLKKCDLWEGDKQVRSDYETKRASVDTEEELIETLGGMPYWMDTVQLAGLELALIGAPESSNEYGWLSDGTDLRVNRVRPSQWEEPRNAFSYDYSREGWPRSAGKPWRFVTPEEHREIIRRLRAGSLTRPGSEVQLRGQTLAEMVADNESTPEWLIDGLLRRGGAAMVVGPSGVGKTWLTHTLMLLAAAGNGVGVKNEMTERPVLKAGEHKGVRVGLLDGEMTKGDITQRAIDLCGALGLRLEGGLKFTQDYDLGRLKAALVESGEPDAEEIAEALGGRQDTGGAGDSPQMAVTPGEEREEAGASIDLSKVVVYAKTQQDAEAEFPDVASPEWKQQIIQWVKRDGIELLVLDNLTTLTPSLEDENSAAQWSPMNSLVVSLKKEGIACLFVHHSNKTGVSYRGSTAIEATLETLIHLDRLQGPQARGGAAFSVSVRKDRANGKPEIDGKTMLLRGGKWCVEIDDFAVASRVVEMVKSLRYCSQRELANELGINAMACSRLLVTARTLKLISEEETRKCLADAKSLRKERQAGNFPNFDEPEPEVAAAVKALGI